MEDKELVKYFQIIKQKFSELEERIKKLEERKSKERPHAIPTETIKEKYILDHNYYAKRKEEDVQTKRGYNTN